MDEQNNSVKCETFDELLSLAVEDYVAKMCIDAFIADADAPAKEPSERVKKTMNHIFREHYGWDSIMFPEVDNWRERLRSRLALVWLKITGKCAKFGRI